MRAPCEIAYWYILPSLRRELVKAMHEKGIRRKEIARMLGVSEASISYYLKSKRGSRYKFNKKQKDEIKKSAERLAEKRGDLNLETCRLCSMFKKSLK